MNDWLKGTTFAPQGAFFSRDAGTGGIAGLTPQGVGAFRGAGEALQGLGQGMMQGQGGAASHPAMMFAQGMQNADAQRRAQQSSALAALLQRHGQPS